MRTAVDMHDQPTWRYIDELRNELANRDLEVQYLRGENQMLEDQLKAERTRADLPWWSRRRAA